MRAFVTSDPLDIPIPRGATYAQGGAELAERIAAEVRRVAGTVEGAVSLGGWGTASLVYDITN